MLHCSVCFCLRKRLGGRGALNSDQPRRRLWPAMSDFAEQKKSKVNSLTQRNAGCVLLCSIETDFALDGSSPTESTPTSFRAKARLKSSRRSSRWTSASLHRFHLKSLANRLRSTSVSRGGFCLAQRPAKSDGEADLAISISLRPSLRHVGTIGHVAHGKSTVVKAISGVMTVRFKNELERNITIKLGYANAKIFKCQNDKCPRPSCYRSYPSNKEDEPPCEVPGCKSKMRLLRCASLLTRRCNAFPIAVSPDADDMLPLISL